jgi:hypothetical protein
LAGHISHGIALCGKMLFQDAMEVFDLAFMFINGDSKTIYLVRLIKARQSLLTYRDSLPHYDSQAIAVFNASLPEEAILLVQKLAAYPDADTLAYRVVQVSIMHSIKPGFAR